MFLVSSCSGLCPIHWSQVLSCAWRCSWSSANMRCPNYFWVIDNFISIKAFLCINASANQISIGPGNGFAPSANHYLNQCWYMYIVSLPPCGIPLQAIYTAIVTLKEGKNINSCVKFILGNNDISAFSVLSHRSDGTGSSNPSPWMSRTYRI